MFTAFRCGTVFVVSMTLTASALGQPATCWQITTVDDQVGSGYNTNLAYGPDGLPHIAYTGLYGTPNSVYWATFDGQDWSIETVDSKGEFYATALAYDPEQNPSMVYFESDSQEVRLARRAHGTWTIEPVAVTANVEFLAQMGLAYGPTGQPTVSFLRDAAMEEVWVADFDGVSWTETLVASGTGDTGEWTSLAYSSAGELALAYNVGFSNITVKIRTGSVWNPSGVFSTGGGIANFGFAYSPSDLLALAYNKNNTQELRYAFRDAGGIWTQESVENDGGSFVGANSDLAFDAQERPVISYIAYTVPDELRIATKDSGTWNIEVVDVDFGDIVLETSVAITPDGDRAISYGDGDYATNGLLKFAFSPGGEADCNLNDVLDSCDLYAGTSADKDGDGVPDECQGGCAGDSNGDGIVDPLDSGYVLSRFGCSVGTGDPDCDAADQNGDTLVDPLDVGYVLSRFGTCE